MDPVSPIGCPSRFVTSKLMTAGLADVFAIAKPDCNDGPARSINMRNADPVRTAGTLALAIVALPFVYEKIANADGCRGDPVTCTQPFRSEPPLAGVIVVELRGASVYDKTSGLIRLPDPSCL